jgi:hypothetical protein
VVVVLLVLQREAQPPDEFPDRGLVPAVVAFHGFSDSVVTTIILPEVGLVLFEQSEACWLIDSPV